MARGAPVTIDDVEGALRALDDAGIKPTVRLVHQKLGRGSMSTITAHLRAVAAARAETEVGELPDPVLASLRGAADALWLELADAADAKIESIATASDSAIAAARAERDAAQSALSDLGDKHGALVVVLAERDATLADTTIARDQLSGERDRLTRELELGKRDLRATSARLADRDGELDRLRASCAHAERALERALAEREKVAAARAADDERHASERAALLADTEAVRRKLETLATATTAQVEVVARLETELLERRRQIKELGTRQATLQDERDVARDRVERLDAALEAARMTATVSERSADASDRAVLALHTHIARLEARLRAAGTATEDIDPIPPLPSLERQPALALRPGDDKG